MGGSVEAQRVNTQQREYARLRQQEHRLRERVRPQMALDQEVDPWMVAARGLNSLDRLRPLCSVPTLREAWHDVAETIRQLAWGPE